jgi:hypothetical protein
MIEAYLIGVIVSLGYQLADEDFRFYDLIVCPLLWPAVLPLQLAIATHRFKTGVTPD